MLDPRLQLAIAEIERYYGRRLHAVALFGSRVCSRPRVDSDWDLLLLLDADEPIRRRLYKSGTSQWVPPSALC
jgi:predicted nucleotidyltransferase